MSLFSRDKKRVTVEETRRHTQGAPAPAVPLDVRERSGNRSQQAVGPLRARGMDAVDVEGGMRQWAAAAYSVVGSGGDGSSKT
ncbi:hypothetical protein [Streptomyces sp. NPDC020330]|uniref:hypothetical protein n=1 Tax=unclassified Streptomyces TaxID=2593676 RepID=UPI0037B07483